MPTRNDLAYKKFLSLLAGNNYNVTKTAIEAGFSEKTAQKQQKRLLRTALKVQAKELEAMSGDKQADSRELKQSIADVIGLGRENVLKEYSKIVEQDRDLSTKYKALIPILKDEGLKVDDTDVSQNIPVLKVTVKDNTAQHSPNIPTKIHDVSQSTLSDTDSKA